MNKLMFVVVAMMFTCCWARGYTPPKPDPKIWNSGPLAGKIPENEWVGGSTTFQIMQWNRWIDRTYGGNRWEDADCGAKPGEISAAQKYKEKQQAKWSKARRERGISRRLAASGAWDAVKGVGSWLHHWVVNVGVEDGPNWDEESWESIPWEKNSDGNLTVSGRRLADAGFVDAVKDAAYKWFVGDELVDWDAARDKDSKGHFILESCSWEEDSDGNPTVYGRRRLAASRRIQRLVDCEACFD